MQNQKLSLKIIKVKTVPFSPTVTKTLKYIHTSKVLLTVCYTSMHAHADFFFRREPRLSIVLYFTLQWNWDCLIFWLIMLLVVWIWNFKLGHFVDICCCLIMLGRGCIDFGVNYIWVGVWKRKSFSRICLCIIDYRNNFKE